MWTGDLWTGLFSRHAYANRVKGSQINYRLLTECWHKLYTRIKCSFDTNIGHESEEYEKEEILHEHSRF